MNRRRSGASSPSSRSHPGAFVLPVRGPAAGGAPLSSQQVGAAGPGALRKIRTTPRALPEAGGVECEEDRCMFQVRIHGRGGQGVVTAAELLSVAAFAEGRYAQAFPTFGSERTGAPVVAFCRIDDRPIRVREPIAEPDAVIVQDPTLLHQVDLFAGLGPDGYLLVNTGRTFEELGLDEFVLRLPARAAADRAGDGARARAPRPAAAERRAARRLRGARPASSRSTRVAAAIAGTLRRRDRRRATPPRRGRLRARAAAGSGAPSLA